MAVDWESLIKTLGPALPFLAGLVGWLKRGRFNKRSRLQADLALLKEVPTDSSGYKVWDEHVTALMRQVIELDREMRRDKMGMGLGAFFVITGASLIVMAVILGQWWWWFLAVPSLLISLGSIPSWKKTYRDEKGRAVPGAPTGSAALIPDRRHPESSRSSTGAHG